MKSNLPNKYLSVKERYPDYLTAVETLGKTIRKQGPLDEKAAQLIQLAASVAIRSEGAAHSHARRAKEAGATPEEIYHALLLLTSTIGFPNVMAGISWVDDILRS
jgi:AhpD family alkylhydroperoxidase